MLVGDATCNHCNEQTAGSAHWLPQYTAVIESGLGHVDDILCTEELDVHLPRMAQRVNNNLPQTPRVSRQNTSFVLPPLNFSNDATLHARPSRRHVSPETIVCNRTLLKRDVAGREHYAHPLLANLYLGDFQLNPCARLEVSAR